MSRAPFSLTRKCARPWLLVLGALALAVPTLVAARPDTLAQQSPDRALRIAIGERVSKDLRGFYAARGNRPVWFDAAGNLSPAAARLTELIRTAQLDGLNPRKLKPGRIGSALENLAKDGTADDRAKAELALSEGYARYVQAMRKGPRDAMIYESRALEPVVPTAAAALAALGAAPSPERYVAEMGWMTPFYAPLRSALAGGGLSGDKAAIAARNLARLRAVPPIGEGRWVLIDAASARLWMFEGTRLAGTMKVVVGKPDTQTPQMAGFLRYAIVNPYWNIPDDMVPSRITEKVLASGPGFVRANRYQLLSGWEEDAAIVDPKKVDWHAVAQGRTSIRARQLPGPSNFMGAVKFMFPNPQGIYLHDTPERDLLSKAARQFSNGCVRLDDAQKFGRWVLDKPLPRLRDPETRIALPVVVPLYITYLTALPEQGRITFRPDVYGRDGPGTGDVPGSTFVR